jgi:hypothetical protein
MIYFLHIKNSELVGQEKLNCKLFFNTMLEVVNYFRSHLPDFIKDKETKYILDGKNLEKFLENSMEIIKIDETICKDYEKLFIGKWA